MLSGSSWCFRLWSPRTMCIGSPQGVLERRLRFELQMASASFQALQNFVNFQPKTGKIMKHHDFLSGSPFWKFIFSNITSFLNHLKKRLRPKFEQNDIPKKWWNENPNTSTSRRWGCQKTEGQGPGVQHLPKMIFQTLDVFDCLPSIWH